MVLWLRYRDRCQPKLKETQRSSVICSIQRFRFESLPQVGWVLAEPPTLVWTVAVTDICSRYLDCQTRSMYWNNQWHMTIGLVPRLFCYEIFIEDSSCGRESTTHPDVFILALGFAESTAWRSSVQLLYLSSFYMLNSCGSSVSPYESNLLAISPLSGDLVEKILRRSTPAVRRMLVISPPTSFVRRHVHLDCGGTVHQSGIKTFPISTRWAMR